MKGKKSGDRYRKNENEKAERRKEDQKRIQFFDSDEAKGKICFLDISMAFIIMTGIRKKLPAGRKSSFPFFAGIIWQEERRLEQVKKKSNGCLNCWYASIKMA